MTETEKRKAHPDLGSNQFWENLRDDPAKLAAAVNLIDMTNLDTTLQRHPALRAWVNATHETARIDEERASWELTKVKARVTLDVKEAEEAAPAVAETPAKGKVAKVVAKPKAKTVGVIAAEVESHPDVIDAQEKLFVAQEKRGALRAMSQALEDRMQMLIQLSANQRAERRDYGGN